MTNIIVEGGPDSVSVVVPPSSIKVSYEVGRTGRRGSIWFAGSGAPGPLTLPEVELFVNDMYMDNSTGDVYQYILLPSNVGDWSRVGTIVGDQDLSGYVQTTNAPELIRDTVGATLVAGSNVTITPDDANDTITIAASNSREQTGTGMPNGVVSAPPGSYYTDTAGTNGAWRWLKKSGAGNTGWECIVGDTGWRNILTVPQASSNTGTNIIGGSILVRRINNSVHFRIESITVDADLNSGAYISLLPALSLSWQPASTDRPHFVASDNDVVGSYTWAFFLGSYLYPISRSVRGNAQPDPVMSAATPPVSGETSWITSGPWPTTLPGTPA